MPYGGELRVGDGEREAAAIRIREAYVEGRLNHDELDARLDAIHRARTRNDLAVISADLPVIKKKRKKSLVPWTYLEVNAALWGIWCVQVATGGNPHDLWPLVVSVPWGVFEGVAIARRVTRRRTSPPSARELRAS